MAKKKAKTVKKAKVRRKVTARKPVRKKAAAKKVKVAVKKDSKKRERNAEHSVCEEIMYRCPGCGRPVKVVKVPGYDVSGMLCQRCSQGEMAIEEEMSE